MRFSKAPLIRHDLVKFFPPAQNKLYEAETAQRWFQLAKKEKSLHLPPIGISSNLINGFELSAQGICGILSLISGTISWQNHRFEDFASRFRENRYPEPPGSLGSNKTLIKQTIQLFPHCQNSQVSYDINTLVLWHCTCVGLSSDSQLFECALGLHGSSISAEALLSVSKWASTATARRASLHAGAIFNLLHNRRLCDHVNFNTAVGTFRAAIVLGLYYLAVPVHVHTMEEHSLELLSNFDWEEIGSCGFPILDEMQIDESNFSEETAGVLHFIRNGGTPHLSGHLHPAGNNTAARVFAHFADLIDGFGRWSPSFFSQCLRAMSVDLMQSDS